MTAKSPKAKSTANWNVIDSPTPEQLANIAQETAAKSPKPKRSAKSKTPKSPATKRADMTDAMLNAGAASTAADEQRAQVDEPVEPEVARAVEQEPAREQEQAAEVQEPEQPAAAEQSQEAKKDENPVGSVTSIAHAHAIDAPISERRAVMESIAQRMAAGESLTKICREPGMPARYTVLRWAGDDPEVFNIYRTGLAMRAELYAEEIIDLADEARGKTSEEVQAIKLMVNSRQWVASRLLPKLYGDHQVIEHTGQVQMNAEQVDQRLAALIRKMQAVEVKR